MRRFSCLCAMAVFASVVVFWLARVHQSRLPDQEHMVPQVFEPPRQTATAAPAFSLTRAGITYTITPLYAYEISGLVVSLFDTATWWNIYHREWNDTLNIKDVCMIWGDNIARQVYRRMRFSSTSFECRYEAHDIETWRQFRAACLSNNHLLPAGEEVERIVREIRRGDQIFLRGYLVTYEHGATFKRGSSTTRDDTGPWSCETIYVTHARILRPHNRFWYRLAMAAKGGFVLAVTGCIGGFWLIPSGR